MIKVKEQAKQKKHSHAAVDRRKKGGAPGPELAAHTSAPVPKKKPEEKIDAQKKEFIKGEWYTVMLTTGTVGTGECLGVELREVRFTGFHFKWDPKIRYQIAISIKNIDGATAARKEDGGAEELEVQGHEPKEQAPAPAEQSGEGSEDEDAERRGGAGNLGQAAQQGLKPDKEAASPKRSISMVVLTSSTTGYGVVVKEEEHLVRFEDFVFASDPQMAFGIAIKRKDIKELVDLKELREDVEKLRVDVCARKGREDAGKEDPEKFLDSEIAKKKRAGPREYTYFYEGADAPRKEECEKPEKYKKWDQFKANERLFGLKPTFDEDIYTMKLDRSSAHYKKYAKEAEMIAREIDSATSTNIHVEEERGRIVDLDEDEKYGSVVESLKAQPKKKAAGKKTGREECRMQICITTTCTGATDDGTDFSSKLFRNSKAESRSENIKITTTTLPPAAPADTPPLPQPENLRPLPAKDEPDAACRPEPLLKPPRGAEPAAEPEGGGKEKKPLATKFNISAPSFNPLAAKRHSFAEKIKEKARSFSGRGTDLWVPWGSGPSYLLYNDWNKGSKHHSPKTAWK